MDTYGWFSGYSWVSMACNLHQLGSSPYNYGETSPLFTLNCARKLCPGFKPGRLSCYHVWGVYHVISDDWKQIPKHCTYICICIYIYICVCVYSQYMYTYIYIRTYVDYILYTSCMRLGALSLNKWSKWTWHVFFSSESWVEIQTASKIVWANDWTRSVDGSKPFLRGIQCKVRLGLLWARKLGVVAQRVHRSTRSRVFRCERAIWGKKAEILCGGHLG